MPPRCGCFERRNGITVLRYNGITKSRNNEITKKKKPRLICPGFDYIQPFPWGTNGLWPKGKAIGSGEIGITIVVIKKPPLLGEVWRGLLYLIGAVRDHF